MYGESRGDEYVVCLDAEPSPHVRGKSPLEALVGSLEPSPHVRGKYFLTRGNTRQSRELDSLSFPMRLDGTGILPDGNPPADYCQPSWS